jgi:parallel beta-helix repeat protein
MSYFKSRWLPLALLYAGLCCSLHAVDGVVLIDQNRALAGSVTPGDAPGFPVTISQPGSYRLSGNLTVPNVDTTAIDITADNVTIDLNGFSIIGPNVCSLLACSLGSESSLGKGVYSYSSSSISVVNGSIRGTGGEGIWLRGFGNYVEKVHVDSSGASGIVVAYGVVIGNTVTRNNTGIQLYGSGTVSGNNAVGNRGVGFQIVCPTAMIGNSAALNGENVRIISGTGCTFTGNAP